MHEPKGYHCPFCRIMADDAHSEILITTEHAACLESIEGHEGSGPSFLIVSKQHFENLYEIPDVVLADCMSLAKRVAVQMRQRFAIDGVTVWQHNEPAGNQDVWHFHIHVKGRKEGVRLAPSAFKRLTGEQRKSIKHQFLNESN